MSDKPRNGFWQPIAEVGGFTKYAALRFYYDDCTQAAASLTYTVLLALVPLTAIIVAIFTAFPAFQELQDTARQLIIDNFVPEVGETVAEHLEGFAINASGLTALGVIGLLVTSILMLATIESSFNAIWHVKESRSWLIRLLTFWAVLTLTPLLFGASISLGSALLDRAAIIGGGTWLLDTLRVLLPIVIQVVGFGLLYWIIPNRSVKWSDAAIGGLVAGVLFEFSKWGFSLYLQAFPVYQTLYGALATVPIFLVWLYLAWSITLFGAVIAAALPDWRSGKVIGASLHDMPSGPRLTIAAGILAALSDSSRLGETVSRDELQRRVPVGVSAVDEMLDQLRQARFVNRTDDDRWVLTRDLHTASLADLISALGIGLSGPVGRISRIGGQWQEVLSDLTAKSEAARIQALSITLASLFAMRGRDNVTPLQLGD